MPTLNWIGKEAVVRHHKDVPYRLLEPAPDLSCGETDSGNLIVEGDNLHALKALLPRYAGKVKCIYIDPPYNTGNEGWVYNDNVNSPEIRRWLGEVVGKEGETLDRHDRWLCMMYPRLVLLKQFLAEDGAIFVSIDDNEVATLRLLMDEVFGAKNFVATIIWQKKQSPQSDAINLSDMHDYVIAYALHTKKSRQDINGWNRNLLPRGEVQDARFSNPDDDPRGAWTSTDYTCNKSADERPNLYYPITNPNTNKVVLPSHSRVWAYDSDAHQKNIIENRIYWGSNGKGKPRIKKYLSEVSDGIVPSTWWTRDFAGDNQESRRELRNIFEIGDSAPDFSTPKPTRLIQRILQIATDKDSLVMDSFAGSGTTAHAVMKQNAEDGGNRKCILVEMDSNIAQTVTAERNKRVINGYRSSNGKAVEGLGGGFQYCKLSEHPLFTADGQIREDVTFAQLAEFVWFAETGSGFTGSATSPLLGIYEGHAIYLLYNGILKDKSVQGGNILTQVVYRELPEYKGPKVIYAAALRGTSWTRRERITFKQTPYALEV